MSRKNKRSSEVLVSEGATSRLQLASLRVGLRAGENSRREVLAQLVVQPQTMTAEQATDDGSQQITLRIALSRLQVLLLLEGGEFDFDSGYTVQVDRNTFNRQEKRQDERSMGGRLDTDLEISTPPGMPVLKGKAGASAEMQTNRTHTQTETAERQYFLVEIDTPPPDADPNQVRRWRIGADGEGGDLERGLPYLRGATYLNRDDRPLATFQEQKGANVVAVDVALAIRREDFHVECVEAGTLANADMVKVKTRLAQLALNRAMKKFNYERITPAMKDNEIAIDVKHKEMNG